MAFGTVLGSYPAPGDAGSIRGIAWDGAHLWIGDHKNNRMLGYDPRSLTFVGSFALSGGKFVKQWCGTNILVADGSQVWFWKPGDSSSATAVLSLAMGNHNAPCHLGGRVVTVSSAGGFVTHVPIPGTFYVAVSSTQPTAFNPEPVMATDGAYVYTSTNVTALLNKHSLPSFSIVATATKPTTDQVDGMHWGGNVLWVSIGGGTDRIYKVAPY